MINTALPTSLVVDGQELAIRSDYRAALDVCATLSDPRLNDTDRALAALCVLYEEPERISDYEEALRQAAWFLSCGEPESGKRNAPRLMDWEHDFKLIVAPINRLVGQEVRSLPYMHWWTFISYYYEIGDCTYTQVVRIRAKRAKRKPLDKAEQEYYRAHRDIVDLPQKLTESEQAALKSLGLGV